MERFRFSLRQVLLIFALAAGLFSCAYVWRIQRERQIREDLRYHILGLEWEIANPGLVGRPYPRPTRREIQAELEEARRQLRALEE